MTDADPQPLVREYFKSHRGTFDGLSTVKDVRPRKPGIVACATAEELIPATGLHCQVFDEIICVAGESVSED